MSKTVIGGNYINSPEDLAYMRILCFNLRC